MERTEMMDEMTQMQKLAIAGQRALGIQVAANQRLQSQVHTLQEHMDAVVDATLAKDRELAEMAARSAHLAELLEQAQAQRDAACAQLNEIMEERDVLLRKAAEWFGKTAPEAKP